MAPFLAMVIPISVGEPTHPISPGGQPPGMWGPNSPIIGNPIAPGGYPPHTWGGRPPNYIDIGGPGPQPIPGWGPGFPTNPIAPGGEGDTSRGEQAQGWAWSPVYGWVWVPIGSGGKPKPPSGPAESEPKEGG